MLGFSKDYFCMCSREVKARTQCPKCPTPQTMLPRHLVKGHKIPAEEVDDHLPPDYPRRIRRSDPAEEEDDPDDVDAWATAEYQSDEDEDYVPDEEEESTSTDEGEPEGDVVLSGDEGPSRGNTPPGARYISGPELAAAVANIIKKKKSGPTSGVSPGVQQAAAAALPSATARSKPPVTLKIRR
jgi:hypothetical protein